MVGRLLILRGVCFSTLGVSASFKVKEGGITDLADADPGGRVVRKNASEVVPFTNALTFVAPHLWPGARRDEGAYPPAVCD